MSVRTLAVVAVQTALLAAVVIFAPISPAQASAGRTFVASTGNDGNTSNNCALATPCRTFTGALGVTTAGGEIVALDTAGYGEVTISGSVSIIAAVTAEVTVTTGTSGITINAGATDTVILRNLVINGGNAANTTGITVNGGHAIVADSTLKLLTIGLQNNGQKVDLTNTQILGNGTGIVASGAGSDPNTGCNSPCTGVTETRISLGNILDNGTAWTMNNPGLGNNGMGPVNKVSIWLTGNTGQQPNLVGNGTYFTVTGTGSACLPNSCTGFVNYDFNSGFAQQ